MFAEEDGFGLAVLEAYNGMLPVTDVIAKPYIEDRVTQVITVEEEPEGVNHTITLGYYDEDCRGIASAPDHLFARQLSTFVA